ncbi:MAG: type I polyketide synthase [Pikeienuella sp.]
MKHSIVINGYSCRLPGANNPAEYWDLLKSGKDAVGWISPDRFSTDRFYNPDGTQSGKSYTFAAGVLDDIWGFDPAFFGISHREALQMDPQQRLIIQVVWEAMEHAGIRPSGMDRSRVGVYVGASGFDHANTFAEDPARMDSGFMLGSTLSIVSNRLSYLFDFSGPSFTVDTACSSSFYALDQARRALEAGEIDTAIVGGVNVLLSPGPFIGFSRAGMLSPDGRCKAFEDTANGYVRAEGAVAFVLRNAELAEENGDPIRGHLLTTDINTDGRTTGVAMPSIEGQSALLRRIKNTSEIDPNDLAFVEAHGTGTQAGDHVEATSIGSVYGAEREEPLLIGSAKTNIGHLEPASGLAGLLKAQLSLEHGYIPPSLYVETLNSKVDFDALNLKVATTGVKIPERKSPWLAGINSFGFGGANSHAVISAKERSLSVKTSDAPKFAPIILSAPTRESLGLLVQEWRTLLQQSDDSVAAELINNVAYRRESSAHTLVVSADNSDEAENALADWNNGRPNAAYASGLRPAAGGTTAFVFSGNGAQWPGMGQSLYEHDNDFRAAFDKVAQLFIAQNGPDILGLLFDENLEEKIARAAVVQPLIFAIQVALVESLAARGVKPDAVVGHSIGEVAAAWSSGALTLTDAVYLIRTRSLALEELHGAGGMAAVLNGVPDLKEALDAFDDQLEEGEYISIAADNNPRSSTISGPLDALMRFRGFARKRRLAVKQLDIAYPYHSEAIEPLKERMLGELARLTPDASVIPFVSSALGCQTDGETLGADYWWQNTRGRVNFQSAIGALTNLGCRCFVEIGPRPVLKNYVMESAAQAGATIRYAETMNNGRRKTIDMDRIAAQVIAVGGNVDPDQYFGPKLPYRRDLPLTPMCLVPIRAAASEASVDTNGSLSELHPLLGWDESGDLLQWRNHLSIAHRAWLADHAVGGAPVFPGTGYLEIALAVGDTQFADQPLEVSGMDIVAPLALDKTAEIRTMFNRETSGVTIESRPYLGGADWTLNAVARVRPDPRGQGSKTAIPNFPRGKKINLGQLYENFAELGLDYGPAFRLIEAIETKGDDQAFVTLSAGPVADLSKVGTCALDCSLHGLLALLKKRPELTDQSYLPVRFGRFRLYGSSAPIRRAQIQVVKATLRGVQAQVEYFDKDGRLIASLSDLRLRAAPLTKTASLQPEYWIQSRRLLSAGLSVPNRWLDAKNRAVELGAAAIEAPESDDGAVLIDAICRKTVRNCIEARVNSKGRLETKALEKISADATPLFGLMLDAMAEDEQFVFDNADDMTGILVPDCLYPDIKPMLAQLSLSAPHYGQEILAVSDLSDSLENALLNGLEVDEGGHSAGLADLVHRVQWTAIKTMLDDLASSWSAETRLNILVVGTVPADVIRAILDYSALTELTLTEVIDGSVEVMKRRTEDHRLLKISTLDEAIGSRDGYDLLIMADRVHELRVGQLQRLATKLSGDGLLVATQPSPDLFSNLLAGRYAHWWTSQSASIMRTGKRFDVAAAEVQMVEAGFANICSANLNSQYADCCVVFGNGSSQTEKNIQSSNSEKLDATLPNLVIFNENGHSETFAEELRALISNAGREKVRRSRLAPPHVLPEEPWEAIIALSCTDVPLDALPNWIVQAMSRVHGVLEALPKPIRLWLTIDGDLVSASALSGMRRVLSNEDAELDSRLIVHSATDADRVSEEILSPSEEPEIYLDAVSSSAPRIEQMWAAPKQDSDALRLDIPRQGALENLEWAGIERQRPGAGEVEIAVRAAGLNFRDVMWAQGLLPEEALENGFAGPTLGMECSGVVVGVGDNTSFQEGERVIAFAPHALSSHVTVSAETVSRMPAQLGFEAAATLPTIFATAQYALVDCARLLRGEWVLIHGGAGGVGLAAIQIAKAIGAQIIATAGSPARRRVLKAIGVDHTLDSRSLSFADEVMALTEGRGVDVVVNSLAGEAMERSIDCLRSFGRFIELGKRDFFADTKLGLRPFRRNLTYFGVDLDQLLAERPDRANAIFAEIGSAFERGDYSPPPYQVYDPHDAVAAFRMMQKSGHFGKVVIRPPVIDTSLPSVPAANQFSTHGGWLVVGGLSGFGMATAERLAKRGAQKLWLVSRSGKASPSDAQRLARLMEAGISVETAALDIADTAAVQAFISHIDADSISLTGVVHSAMVLRDKPFSEMTFEDMDAVFAPKVKGAMNLDLATRNLALEHFVLYSSAVVLFGNPHQSPYVAANAALDQIARDRVASGLPALAIGWGAIGDSGYLTREEQTRAMLDTMLEGAFITEVEALDGLEHCLSSPSATNAAITFARLPWPRLSRDLPIVATPLFERLRSKRDSGRDAAAGAEIRAEIAALSPRDALKRVLDILREETANVLYQPVAEIDPIRPLSEIGFDSLMAVELRMSIEDKIGLSLPLLSLADATTLTDVAGKVVQMIQSDDVSTEDAMDSFLAQHASNDEMQKSDVQEEIRGIAGSITSLA